MSASDSSDSRTGVVARLRAAVSAVIEGRSGATLLVEGPPGIGKTVLCRGLVAAASEQGATVVFAAAQERRRREGFAVVHDLVGPTPQDEDAGEVAFARIDAWCARDPVLCWVDDAHDADADSLGVLRRLVWASRDLPLVVLLSARIDADRAPLNLLAAQADIRVQLPGMDSDAIAAVVAQRTGCRPAPRLQAYLAAAGGNPLFAVEMLDALADDDRLDRGATGIVDLRGDPGPVGALDALIQVRLGDLGPAVGEIVAALAVLGTETDESTLAELLFTTPDALAASIDRAIGSGVVKHVDTQWLAIAHDVYREVAYASLAPPRRRAMHRRAADVLRGRGAPVAALAEHLVRAARSEPIEDGRREAAAALHEAARAAGTHAPAVTAELLEDLFAFADSDQRDRAVVDRAHALFVSGQPRRAELLAAEHVALVRDPALVAELFAVLVRAQLNRADPAAALGTVDRLLARPGLPAPAIRRLTALRCWVSTLSGQWQEAANRLETLLTGDTGEDPELTASLLTTTAITRHLAGRDDVAVELMSRYAALTLPDDAVSARTSALVWPPAFALAARGPDAAMAEMGRSRTAAASVDAHWLGPYLSVVSAEIAVLSGRWDDAAVELATALEIAEVTGAGWISGPVARLAFLDAHRGRLSEATRRLREFAGRGLPLQFGIDDPGQAEIVVLDASGDNDAAVARARKLWSAAADAGPACMVQMAADVARIGLTGGASDLCALAAGDVSSLDLTGCPVLAPVADLVVAMSEQDVDRLAETAGVAAELGNAPLAAQAAEEAACAAAARGERAGAREHGEVALERYRSMGAVADTDRVLGRLRSLGVRRGPRERHRTAVTGAASLTPTEQRIAALVGEHLTNPQIAAQLWLSPRTVQTHVSHILTKLDVRSRSMIAEALRGAEVGS